MARPRRYVLQTFGCQMNAHDSLRIEEKLQDAGYEPAQDTANASLVVVNTCSIRDKAEHKLMSMLGTYRLLKQERADLILAVAGCVAQQEGDRLLRKAPYVDFVFGPDNISDVPWLLHEAEGGAPPRVHTVFDLDQPAFLPARPRAGDVTSYVTTMKGCDERCTFCIVPHTRGPERYRPADEIVGDIARLVDGGAREITLLGQTVNSWHDPSRAEPSRTRGPMSTSDFPALLRQIAGAVPSLVRLRYTSPHPRHVTEALIAAHAELDVLPAHVHLPVQSGADRVLRRMKRRYTRDEYIERARRLQGARSGMTLSTDIIVGFPGETEEDFAQTLSLVEEVGFVSAFCFKYSERPYTPALRLGPMVDEAEKDERLRRLFSVIDRLQSAHLGQLVGSQQTVLVEGPSPGQHGGPDAKRWVGRTERNEIVHVEASSDADLTASMVDVTILEAYRRSLLGRMDAHAARPAPRRMRLPLAG